MNDEVDRLIEEMREQLNLQRKEIANLKRQLAAQPQPHNAALVSVMASLVAAISLLERSPKTAAPSDPKFDFMLNDYRRSLEAARAVLFHPAAEEPPEVPPGRRASLCQPSWA